MSRIPYFSTAHNTFFVITAKCVGAMFNAFVSEMRATGTVTPTEDVL